MKKQGIFFLIILFVFCVFSPVQGLTAEKVDFKTYDKGIKLVKSLNKKAFIDFHADWCKYCIKMEKEVFTNKKVIEYLNDNFISITVDTEKEEKVASKYKIKGLPQLYFLMEDGSPIKYRPGFVEAEELLQALKYINTDSYKKMSFSDFVNQN